MNAYGQHTPRRAFLASGDLSGSVLLESVPNLSLGPQDEALDPVLAALRRACSPACRLLDVHTDPDHRRTVLTLAGAPVPLLGVLEETRRALAEHASLADHEGVHPRVGLLDVVPFLALDAPRAEAHRAARSAEQRLASAEVPVYRYAEATEGTRNRSLAEIRRRLEGASLGGQAPLAPDAGPAELHPRMGAACVGVRDLLVAYNVVLETRDPELGRQVASRMRGSSGGLPGLQALAFPLASREGRIQVSTNITDTERVGIADVYERVRQEAARQGTEVLEGELVGLAPSRVLPKSPSEGGLESLPASLEEALADAGFSLPPNDGGDGFF